MTKLNTLTLTFPISNFTNLLFQLNKIINNNSDFVKFIVTQNEELRLLINLYKDLDIQSIESFTEMTALVSMDINSPYANFFKNLKKVICKIEETSYLRDIQHKYMLQSYTLFNSKLSDKLTIDDLLPEQPLTFYYPYLNNLSIEIRESKLELKNISGKKIFFFNDEKKSKSDMISLINSMCCQSRNHLYLKNN